LEVPKLSAFRWLRSLTGSFSRRALARAEVQLERIQTRGKALRNQSDDQLREVAGALRKRVRGGESLNALLAECYALVREMADRTLKMRHFDVQVLGGIVLHQGHVAEMKTGEGKTLVATLPACLQALTGKGVHVVTVNDYLAARDAEWMGPIYEFMGFSVGVVTEDMDPDERPEARKTAYAADITYVTNHELVFDSLRDNLAITPDEVVLRPLNYALVDEVDLLLLDEARTPLIISGPTGDDPGHCLEARDIVSRLRPNTHFDVDHKSRQVKVKDSGWTAMERALGIKNLAEERHLEWQHVLYNAMLAHAVYERDVDYIVEEDKVYLIDEFTGRVSPDKRFADGLHQALEAKEDVTVRSEDRTLAKTSYQMFFAGYPTLCGMTGTAVTVREEFQRTYGLRVVAVPTNRPGIRRDLEPVVYKTSKEKFASVAEEISRLLEAGRPVLVGTTSVRESEHLSGILKKSKIPHQVLNAKNHEEEAAIISRAGQRGTVTISTNMAGRGVDIVLGDDQVKQAGGLAVIGTGLHEAQRIDNQLRGRSGRQGDPGSSRYFLSLDDPIYKRFGEIDPESRVLDHLRQRLSGHPQGERVRDRSVLRTLDQLRKKVETENEAIRKEVLKYDVVIEKHRKTIYEWRAKLVVSDPAEAAPEVDGLTNEIAEDLIYRNFAGEKRLDRELYENLENEARTRFGIDFRLDQLGPAEDWSPERAGTLITENVRQRLQQQRALLDEADYLEIGREILLTTIDNLWTEHLTTLERLDEGIGLRSYAQLDPLVEFRREANLLYQDLLREIRLQAVSALLSAHPYMSTGRVED
jgi:preprotein translocase subunit SecA